jgi:hypothetical protein
MGQMMCRETSAALWGRYEEYRKGSSSGFARMRKIPPYEFCALVRGRLTLAMDSGMCAAEARRAEEALLGRPIRLGMPRLLTDTFRTARMKISTIAGLPPA